MKGNFTYEITMKLLNCWRPLVPYNNDKYFKILLFTYHQKKMKIIFTDNAQTVLRQQMTAHGMNA